MRTAKKAQVIVERMVAKGGSSSNLRRLRAV
jgi:hypothetical protein